MEQTQRVLGRPTTPRDANSTKHALAAIAVALALCWSAPAFALIRGIDISSHQGNISAAGWQQIKASGVDFAFARVSLGACCDFDANYVNNFNRAIAAGVPIGPYAVGYPHTNSGDPNDAVNEANYLVSLMKPYYQGSGLILRPVLDIELPLDKSLSQEWHLNFRKSCRGRLIWIVRAVLAKREL